MNHDIYGYRDFQEEARELRRLQREARWLGWVFAARSAWARLVCRVRGHRWGNHPRQPKVQNYVRVCERCERVEKWAPDLGRWYHSMTEIRKTVRWLQRRGHLN